MSTQRPTDTGRYAESFLNMFVGKDNYTIHRMDIPKDEEGFAKAVEAINRAGFANVTDTGLTLVNFGTGDNEWMEELGHLIEVRNSPKVAKRLTLITRLTYLAAEFNPGDLNIVVVNSDDYSNYGNDVMFLDGANAVSTELLEECMTQGMSQFPVTTPPEERAKVNRGIDRSGGGSFRCLTPDGLIKGDYIVAPRAQLGGADIVYHEENMKTELKSKEFLYVLLEPHPRHNDRVAWLDEQTDSWLGPWLFPQNEKDTALRDYLDLNIKDLEDGIYPRVFSDPEDLSIENDLIDQFRRAALTWVGAGMKLNQSIFLFKRIADSVILTFRQPGRKPKDRKMKIPVRCAWNSYVATDAMLALAGFEEADTPRGCTWYHEPSDRMIMHDLDFVEAYARHGGWDLDDMPMWVFRTINGERKVICIRRPNGPGEYNILDWRPGSAYPQWERANGEVVEFPEVLGDRPPFLEELDITYTGMPKETRDIRSDYSREAVIEALKTAMDGAGTFGRWANAQMVFNRSTGSYREVQLEPTETIIDTCTQEPTAEKLAAIDADTKATLAFFVNSGIKVDKVLWKRRVGHLEDNVKYTDGDYARSWRLYRGIVDRAEAKLKALSQSCQKNFPQDIIDAGKNERLPFVASIRMPGWGDRTFIQRYRDETEFGKPPTDPAEKRKFWSDINDRLVSYLSKMPVETRNMMLLAIANFVYTKKQSGSYKDNVLYGTNMDAKTGVLDLFIEAIHSVRQS